ncbi:hypothetical protein IW262DRAFT_338292 [Armillaria fumosa]|nr:hypothetical protein IW262DRAFT_338292 [Armillaria fumosa]
MHSNCHIVWISTQRTPLHDIFSQTAPTTGSPSSTASIPPSRTTSIMETPAGNVASTSNRTTAPSPVPSNANSSQSATCLPERKCGCQCRPTCSCSCPCRDHCICPPGDHTCNETCNKKKCKYKCWGTCGSRKNYRNLVVCLDGTSNQFGHFNTNVVELHGRVLKDDGGIKQLTFYSSGIGTHVPSGKHSLGNWLYNAVDMAIAWNFQNIVEKAYRWLADNYKPNDRIYLFGFSRGAYQVRALAGMIERLGLVFAGNTALIPLAYELYRNKHRGRKIRDQTEAEAFAANFKRTFSRKVKVHFIGAWDTVSSVGFIRQRPLPLTTSASHICFFRQGLALDERRVKFLPEFLTDGRIACSHSENPESNIITNVKEVWFVGSHSDIGGSNERRHTFDLTSVPLSWMEHEASEAGLRFAEREAIGEWKWDHLRKDEPTRSLHGCWWIPEYLPIKTFVYSGKEISTTHERHRGRGRSILPQQHIHASVMFQHKGYTPSATFLGDKGRDWASLLEISDITKLEDLSWADEWAYMLEMDLFDDSMVRMTIGQLKGDTLLDPVLLLRRLAFMALSDRCAKKIAEVISELVAMLSEDRLPDIQVASASCLFQLAKHWYGEEILDKGC